MRLYERVSEMPMVILAVVWLGILIAELVYGSGQAMSTIGVVIWIIFILDFLLRLILAPQKLRYVARNWLTAIALAIPALRVFRALRALRVIRIASRARATSLVRIVSSVSRGMRAFGRVMARRGVGYVALVTIVVTFAGAAGTFYFEREANPQITTYADALWFTAMNIATVGTDIWPKTGEGRILSLLISFYALGILGYVTATLASFFVGREAAAADSELPDADTLKRISAEMAQLKSMIADLARRSRR